MLEWLRGLRKTVYSLDHWFITKDIKGYESTADEGPNEGALGSVEIEVG